VPAGARASTDRRCRRGRPHRVPQATHWAPKRAPSRQGWRGRTVRRAVVGALRPATRARTGRDERWRRQATQTPPTPHAGGADATPRTRSSSCLASRPGTHARWGQIKLSRWGQMRLTQPGTVALNPEEDRPAVEHTRSGEISMSGRRPGFGVRRVPLPAGSHHAGCPLVPPVRAVLP